MACRLFDVNPLSESMLFYYWLNPQEQTYVKFKYKYIFIYENIF